MNRLSACSVLLGCAILVTGAGCSRKSTSGQGEANRETTQTSNSKGTAFVRYLTAMDAHTGSDLYFGQTDLFSSAEASKPTDYKQVPAERRDFALRESGNPNGVTIQQNSEGLGDGKYYTVIAYEDKDAKPVLRVVNDDESAPANGKAKIRIIHAGAGMEPVEVYVSGQKDKFASESRFSSASNWQEVNPVNGTLDVRVGSGNDRRVIKVPDARIEAGKLYTLVIEGGPKTSSEMRVVQLVNNPKGA